jgi:hypothetical protein
MSVSAFSESSFIFEVELGSYSDIRNYCKGVSVDVNVTFKPFSSIHIQPQSHPPSTRSHVRSFSYDVNEHLEELYKTLFEKFP